MQAIKNIVSAHSLLDGVASPADLKELSIEELNQLCAELRSELIATISETGGHLASSLGVVEITVALHKVFNTPEDRLVWDVGHQAYIHKMLTGRRNQLNTVRQLGGLSGFPKREESIYDAFGVGHASTAISAAVGMLEASHHDYPEQAERKVVAIVGDGALTSGMSFEALNHAGHLQRNLIVILNDNGMSIAQNVGALSWAFSRTITNRFSTTLRKHFKKLVARGWFPSQLYKLLDRVEETTQGFFSSAALLFNGFGFRYLGPIDGHDIHQLIKAIEHAKDQDGPVVIHAITTKGKGYKPAEEDPVKFHGVVPFERENGHFKLVTPYSRPALTEVFGQSLVELAHIDQRIVGITAAMPGGTGLEILRQEFPDKFFDVGICEEHAITFAAGLACEGMRPVCAIYSSFLQRAYDQILHDLCLQKLPVVLVLDRAGLVGSDGPTHHGVFDLSYLRSMPNMTIMAPADEHELRNMLFTALNYSQGPVALRFPRGHVIGKHELSPMQFLPIGKGQLIKHINDKIKRPRILLISIGWATQTAVKVAEILEKNNLGASIFNGRFVKPLDEKYLLKLISDHDIIVTIEDNIKDGGFGSAILEFMADNSLLQQTQVIRCGINDCFIPHGSIPELHKLAQIDATSIYHNILAALEAQATTNRLSIA
ncbi:MAG: 1-deoxy-D-xylulose-5-phosphate synthase [Deltaproteobacteria bacterium]|nr:1-deoxy-D-xylulose-5-phosphate synthase [Deltaproteobacteria bacterium]